MAGAPSPNLSWKWLAAAAGLVLAIGLAWQLPGPWRESTDPVYRSVDGRSISSLVPEDVPLPRRAPVLRWTAIEGARYRVRVLTADLEPLDEVSNLPVPEHTLRPEMLSGLPAGTVLLWQVEADVAGAAAVVSPTFRVRLE